MSTSAFSTTRLYVGNLAQSVDEYTLIQVCSKFGKIAKLDYLFHKAGPSKGKPRGYAFVEYATKDEALRAMVALHDRVLRGRNLVVTAASEQAQDERGPGTGKRPRQDDAARPTAISLLKGQGVSGGSTGSKIAALEAKLNALRKGKSKESTPEASASNSSTTDAEDWLNSLGGATVEQNLVEDSSVIQAKEAGSDEEKGKGVTESTVAAASTGTGHLETAEPVAKAQVLVEEEPAPKRKKVEVPTSAGLPPKPAFSLPPRPSFDANSPPRRR